MKSIFAILLLLLILPGKNIAQADSAQKAREIISIEQQLMDALPGGDKMPWEKYLEKDCFIITEDGTYQTKAQLIDGIHPFPKGFSGYIIIAKPHLSFRGNAAVIQYVADEHETVFGQQLHTTYSTTNTYYYGDDRWKLIAGQTFEIPQVPSAIKIPAKILQTYTGIYELTEGRTYTISTSGDTLFGQKNGREKEVLFAETRNIFFRTADSRGRKLFIKDGNGTWLLRERRNGQDLVWKKIK